MPPAVVMIAASCSATTRSSASRSWRRKVAVPAISIRSGMLAPYSSSTRRSSSMNGQPRCCASMRPSVDLPAPRKPTSAMRRAAIGAAARATRAAISLSQRRQLLLRHLRQTDREMAPSSAVRAPLSGSSAEAGRSSACAMRAQHADRRIAGAAFDLRQIPLRRFGGLRQLPARHAALGAILSHFAADGGEECGRLCEPARRNGSDRLGQLGSGGRLGHGSHVPMHYSSCAIMHALSRICKLASPERSGATGCVAAAVLLEHLPPAAVVAVRRAAVRSSIDSASGPGSSGACTSGITGFRLWLC